MGLEEGLWPGDLASTPHERELEAQPSFLVVPGSVYDLLMGDNSEPSVLIPEEPEAASNNWSAIVAATGLSIE